MDATPQYHKYNASDMKEIRKLRSISLMGYKLMAKSERVSKISKAILPDIQWNKIANITCSHELVEELDSAITDFREHIHEQLHLILSHEFDKLFQQVNDNASTPEIQEAAHSMANKYNRRSTKKKKKHRPSKPTNNTPTTAKSPPTPPIVKPQVISNSPSIFTPQVPHSFNFNIKKQTPSINTPIKSPTSFNKFQDSHSSQPCATVMRDSSSSPPRSINETRQTHQPQPFQLSNTTNGAHCQSESTNGSYRSTGLRHNNKAKQQSLKHSFQVKKATKRNIFK